MSTTDLLQLLLDEAPAETFEGPVNEARRRGEPPEEVERLQEQALLALQLRSILGGRRRREGELAALYETAGDLISIRDLERVLQAIVRRARRLLNADTAYLTLIDERRGDTYMRVTEGIVDEGFRAIRLPLGKGLGGLVAQNVRPAFTSNYLDDPQFDHTSDIDSVVGAEGIVAIVGVPLLVGEGVIGVLFAADRRERRFSPDEVNLLQSLAAHAAIAIENARLFQEAQQALAELNAATALIQAHSQAVERAAAAHERLTDVVLAGGDLGDVAGTLAEVVGGTILVLDPEGRVLASAGTAGEGDRPEADLAELLRRSAATGRTSRADDGTGPWVTPVVAGAEQLGALVVCDREDLDGADLRTFERAAQVTALLLLMHRSVAEAEQRMRGEFLEDVLAHATRDAEGLRRRARLLGVDLDAEHAVVVASTGGDARGRQVVTGPLARLPGGLVAQRGSATVVLVPGDGDPTAAAQRTARWLREQLGGAVTAGAAGPASTPAGIAEAFAAADRCRRTLIALGREGESATVSELGVYALLFNESGRAELERFVDHSLGALLRYDDERGTALIPTLEAYFDHGGNLTRAAEALHIHVNTLYQRLDRIGTLLERDWQRAEASLQLHLALTIHRLRAAV